jgi:hypothetical protein
VPNDDDDDDDCVDNTNEYDGDVSDDVDDVDGYDDDNDSLYMFSMYFISCIHIYFVGNYIVDLFFTEPIKDVKLAASELKSTGRY